MRLAAIAFTARGLALGQRLAQALCEVELTRGFGDGRPALRNWTADAMAGYEGVIFIGAAGIAVRAIAPHLGDKRTDPAVVVVDEQGRFAISLLSGHAGGANELAERVAQAISAQPVITTATDGRGLFAVDVWAKRHGITLMNPEAAKAVSAALLAGAPVGIASEFPIEGLLPGGMTENAEQVGVYIGWDWRKAPFSTTLYAIPPALALGIGCRKGVGQDVLAARVDAALARIGGTRLAVRAVHTIDRKAEEPGLCALCGANGWPLQAFSAERLRAVPGAFTASPLVEETVGVDNVCERAAVATGGRLLLRKQAAGGVTVAIAALPYKISFAEA
ncbi:cobalamin biosynthesis protein [Eubacteriales bacterium OttesenSCG-928-A19]|nr:cobalamin biosynthesis protein [Eubacteriales bacterium OttesenSCG-928-A19]